MKKNGRKSTRWMVVSFKVEDVALLESFLEDERRRHCPEAIYTFVRLVS